MSEHSFIVKYDAVAQIEGGAWEELAVHVANSNCSSKDEVNDCLVGVEDEWFAEYKPTATKPNGDWKRSELPKSYQTAKSVVRKAVEARVELVNGDGTPKGKSAVEGEYKAAVVAVSKFEQGRNHLNKVQQLWDDLSPTERDVLKGMIMCLPV